MHKGPQKYPPETKQLARSKADAGMSLSDIARELNASKSTVKYWLDHPDDPQPGIAIPNGSSIKTQCSQAFWDVFYSALLQIKKSLRKMTWMECLGVIKELLPYLQAISALESRGITIPEKIVEVSQEIKVRIQDYLKKQSTTDSKTGPEMNLGGEPAERAERPQTAAALPQPAPTEKESNGAT